MMGKTLMKKAGELEAQIRQEMADLYVKLKGGISEDQKEKLRARLKSLETLITGEQAACAPCSGGTRFFNRKK